MLQELCFTSQKRIKLVYHGKIINRKIDVFDFKRVHTYKAYQ